MWTHILVGWVLLLILPKLAVLPVYRWLWHAMKASDALDAADAAWLRGQEGDGRWPPPWRQPDPQPAPRSGPERRHPGGGRSRRRSTRVG
jgi:hypothetical protein